MLDFSGLWVVLSLLILLPCVVIGYGVFLYHERAQQALKANPKKRTVQPQKAHPQPGVCLCDDGFNFHIDAKRCNVEGCPCVLYVPSDAEVETIKEVELVSLARLALEGVNAQTDWVKKQTALEASKEEARRSQLGALNTGQKCDVCRQTGHAYGRDCPHYS